MMSYLKPLLKIGLFGAMAIYLFFKFRFIDLHSHSVSDTILGFSPYLFVCAVIYVVVLRLLMYIKH